MRPFDGDLQASRTMTQPFTTKRLPRSLYADTARERAATPPLAGDRRVGTVVIGGGFTGLSTALHLARRGVDVAVLEAGEPGWGASGRNGGQVNPGLKSEPDAVERDFGTALGSRMVAFSGGAPQRVFDLIREHQIQCEADQSGTIRAAYSEAAASFLRNATEGLQRRGAPVEFLGAERMASLTGSTRYCAGALDRRGGSVNPLGYARGLADAAIGAGAAIHGQTAATALVQEAQGWRVEAPRGAVRAALVVVAPHRDKGARWPGLKRSIVPVFSGIVASEPLPSDVARRILPGRSVLYEHESITVYYRVDRSDRLLMGGRSRLRPLDSPGDFTDLMAYATRLWPFIGKPRWKHGWNGQLAITTDHYPHLHEPARNLVACLGYNGRGIAMGTAMGAEIARRITGTPAVELDMPVSPIRPIPFHRFWRVGAAARIAYGRARNALQI